MTAPVIAVSLGHLTSFEAGLGEFGRRLGEGLAARVDVFAARGFTLAFHMVESLHGAFGPRVAYFPYRSSQLAWAPSLAGCVLWHNTFQHAATAPPATALHRLLTVHDLNYRYTRRGPGAWRSELVTRLAIRRSNRLVAISDFVAEDVRRHIAPRSICTTIHNGATDLSSGPRTPVESLVGRPFFFHVSRMAATKNVDSIVALARAWPERQFVLAGPAWGDSKALHDELGTSLSNLRVLLGIDDASKAWLLANCEAFLFPSFAEGFGLPPIEAMHFGTPVFLARRASLPEVGGHEAAYFDDFAPAAMRAVIETELPRLQSRRDAIRRQANRFDWDVCIDRYTALYFAMLGGRDDPDAGAGLEATNAREGVES